jgi:predicted signal transduction protein with EAL and GGDEF domain
MDAARSQAAAFARAIVSRRAQTGFRIGLAAIVAAIFQFETGWTIAGAWFAVYSGLQLIERQLLRHTACPEDVTPASTRTSLALLLVNATVFSSFGLILVAYGGAWALACSVLLWSGALLNGAVAHSSSRAAMTVSVLPPAVCFLVTPYLVIMHGGPLIYGFAMLAAGALNAVTISLVSTTARRLLDAEKREDQATYVALHDPETNLPNRRALEEEIPLVRATAGTRPIVVAALGIDRYNEVRGAIGYALFADLAKELARRLATVHGDGKIARLSGATLGLVFTAADKDAARDYATLLQETMETPIDLGDNAIDVSLTIGLAVDGGEPGLAASPVQRAHIALDQARIARRRVAFFDGKLYGNPAGNLSLMSEMLRGIANGDLFLHHQPKYDIRSGEITGIEALVRWRHPHRGVLVPGLFVPMAEETGHIRKLTEWVLAQALADQAKLLEAGHDLFVSVNLSGKLVGDREFADTVLAIVGSGVRKLFLEVTETSIMENPEIALEVLEKFRAAGICISIDDYGSGLSSLAYLKNIPATELKIDQTFVFKIAESQKDALMVRSTIDLAHSLGLQVTAEGVETEIALSLLAAMHCDMAQGYLIARPMPIEDLFVFLENRGRAAAEPARLQLPAPPALSRVG